MRTKDLTAAALAGLENRGSTNPTDAVVEKVEDEVISSITAGSATELASSATELASSATELAVVSSSANDSVEKKSKRERKRKENHTFPVEPRVIQVVKKPRTYINHSYRDFSSVPAAVDYVAPEKISDMTFSHRMYHILSQQEYKKWIGWRPHGRSFQILVPKKLEQGQILQKYFGHGRYSSFLRQLSKNGFKHISNGPDRNSYYHECFIRGLPHLVEYMPESKDARRLVPDPENELDFYDVSSKYPLPDDPNFDMTNPLDESEKSIKSQVSHLAKRPKLMSGTNALKGDEAAPAPRINTMAASVAAAPDPFGSPIISQIGDLVNSTSGASKVSPRINSLHGIMGQISAAAGPSSAPVPVAAAAPFAHREHYTLSQLQEVISRNNRNNQFLAAAALNNNLGGFQQQPQQQQPQNPSGNLGHILAGFYHFQSQPPLVPQGNVQTQSELVAAFLQSAAAAPSYGSY